MGTELSVAVKESQADVVFDCTVPSAHVPVDTAALEAGCHVLCKKPLGELTTATADFFPGAHFDGFRAEIEHVLLLDVAIDTF